MRPVVTGKSTWPSDSSQTDPPQAIDKVHNPIARHSILRFMVFILSRVVMEKTQERVSKPQARVVLSAKMRQFKAVADKTGQCAHPTAGHSRIQRKLEWSIVDDAACRGGIMPRSDGRSRSRSHTSITVFFQLLCLYRRELPPKDGHF